MYIKPEATIGTRILGSLLTALYVAVTVTAATPALAETPWYEEQDRLDAVIERIESAKPRAGTASSEGRPGAAPAQRAAAESAPDATTHRGGAARVHAIPGPLEPRPLYGDKTSGTDAVIQRAAPSPFEPRLSFPAGTKTPAAPGLGQALQATLEQRQAGNAYAFLLTRETLTPERERRLADHGIEVLDRHGQAYKVRIDASDSAARAADELPFVYWLGTADTRQKIAPRLAEAVARRGGQLPVVINLFEADRSGDFTQRLSTAGASMGAYQPDLAAYEAVVPAQAIGRIAELDFVLYVEPVPMPRPALNTGPAQVGGDYIRPGGPGTSYGAADIPIGVIDTGFQVGSAASPMHQDLNKNACAGSSDGFSDEHGHGTHVLSIATGTGTADDRFRGMATAAGSDPNVRLRVYDCNLNGGGSSTGSCNEGMEFMSHETACSGTSPRPAVVNMSFGSGGNNYGSDAQSRKLDSVTFNDGVLQVVSAGNGGTQKVVSAPAQAKTALSVANLDDDNENFVLRTRSGSSSFDTEDGRMKPEIAAPGSPIRAADANDADGYVNMGGTSMASPMVAGAAATVMDHYEQLEGEPAAARAFLMATAMPAKGDLEGETISRDGLERNAWGLGHVSSYGAHRPQDNSRAWAVWFAYGDVNDSQYISWEFDVPPDTDRLKVVMTWDEPAASAGSTTPVRNDLDLYVDHGADCSDPDGACGEYDSISASQMVEYVVIDDPPAGTYRMKAAPYSTTDTVRAGLSAHVIRGDPEPALDFSSSVGGDPSGDFTVTTTASPDSYIASAVEVGIESMPSDVFLEDARVTRPDGVDVSFGASETVRLGDIPFDHSREVVWEFRRTCCGSDNDMPSFRATPANGKPVHTTPDAMRRPVVDHITVDEVWRKLVPSSGTNGNVAIAGPATFEGSDAGALRVRDKLREYELRLEEWPELDGPHVEESASFMQIDTGHHVAADGSHWEAGRFDLSGTHEWDYVSFAERFPGTPHVFLTVQTQNDSEPVTVIADQVDSFGFEAAMVEGDGGDPGHGEERVGYVAIYSPRDSGRLPITDAQGNTETVPYILQRDALSKTWATGIGMVDTRVQSGTDRLFRDRFVPKEARDGIREAGVDRMIIGDHVFAQVSEIDSLEPITVRQRRPAYSPLGDPGEVDPPAMEWGVVKGVTDEWMNVPFHFDYDEKPIVIAKPMSSNHGDGGAARLGRVHDDGFRIHINEWNSLDDSHGTEEWVFYMVAEPGVHQLNDLTVEAGRVYTAALNRPVPCDVDAEDKDGDGNLEDTTCNDPNEGPYDIPRVDFALNSFDATPAVFTDVQTFNGADAVVTRMRNLDSSGFDAAMDEEEGDDSTDSEHFHIRERIGYIAVERGITSVQDFPAAVLVSHYNVDEQGTRLTGTVIAESERRFPMALGDVNTNNGDDPFTLRHRDLAADGITFYLDEETSGDSETGHVEEDLAAFIAQ